MMNRTFWIKAAALVAIGVLLSLALARIGFIVDERQMRQREAVASVEQAQAGAQTLLGPLLHRTCVEEWDVVVGDGKDRRTTAEKREFRLAATPQRLEADGALALEPRYRGLFKVNAYAGKLVLDAQWDTLAALQPERQHAGSRLQCSSALLMLALSDARGIRSAQLSLAGEPTPVRPGTAHPSHARGLHAVVPDARLASPLAARLTVELVGTGDLAFVPAATAAQVRLRSDWPHPSFGGRFLPATREVGDAGFTATWKVSALASNASAEVERGAALCPAQPRGGDCLDTLAVSFIDPVNPYVLSDRAIKYGLLFVVLTFVAVALVEVLASRRVHPVQYGLVGSALSVFFLLLLSLSEHLAFGWSYALAAAGCVALLGFYGAHMLGGAWAGVGFGVGIGALYGALYLLLQMEQTALVIGSLMLFGALALVMVLTRRVDWYAMVAPRAASIAG